MATEKEAYNMHPFRRAVFRGLGLVLPPLLTVVILLWIGNSVQKFILDPVEWSSRQGIVWFMNDTKDEIPKGAIVLEPEIPDARGRGNESSTDSGTATP